MCLKRTKMFHTCMLLILFSIEDVFMNSQYTESDEDEDSSLEAVATEVTNNEVFFDRKLQRIQVIEANDNFIEQAKAVGILPKSKQLKVRDRSERMIFTKFLQKLVSSVMKMPGVKALKFIEIVVEEIKRDAEAENNYFPEIHCEQTESAFRSYLKRLSKKDAISVWRLMLEYETKLAVYSNMILDNSDFYSLLDHMNDLYDTSNLEDMKSFLTGVLEFAKDDIEEIELAYIVGEGLRNIVLKHVSNMGVEKRFVLKNWLQDMSYVIK